MSDQIKHECGIAFIRLLKPLEYYHAKYGTSFYGMNKLYLMMEKQHNRGQDGAGIANIKFDMKQGLNYIDRNRSNSSSPIKDVFEGYYRRISEIKESNPERLNDVNWLKGNVEFTGELFLGHVRYGTYGKNNIQTVHPVLRKSNWMSKSLVIAGNFNLTNVDELFETLINIGQHPVETSDTITILEKMGHFLDNENEEIYRKCRAEGCSKVEASDIIAKNLDVQKILTKASRNWDGGYVIAGMYGHGDAFIMRDPAGIRPVFYYQDDEVIVAASERPVIQTAFQVDFDSVKEIHPGYALIIKKDGNISEKIINQPTERRSCSFERIYFSRGTDSVIYKERKMLGKLLAPAILKAIGFDLENTVFSYIPNTASVAFRGLAEELENFCNGVKKQRILDLGSNISDEKLDEILKFKPRIERIAVKDIKLRTFITDDNHRDDLVTHVYDITYGTVRKNVDSLVVIDDSIVRGTTLKQSIVKILDRLNPKKIIVASSAPQIRYPDCYGIDMAKLNDFVAFRAAIELLKEKKMSHIITEVYNKCKEQENLPKEEVINAVKEIYKPFKTSQISEKICELLKPSGLNAKFEIVYQTIEDLHEACPNDTGDWYFTGNYPTPGGNKVVNRSFINYIEGKNIRAY